MEFLTQIPANVDLMRHRITQKWYQKPEKLPQKYRKFHFIMIPLNNSPKPRTTLTSKQFLPPLNPCSPPPQSHKGLKVSDLMSCEDAHVFIVYGVNRKKDGRSASGIPQIFEVIKEGSVFEGMISLDENAGKIKHPLSFEEILEALKSFYEKEFERENKILEKFGIKFEKPSKGVLVRIGKHSGAECVTIEGFRKIWVRRKGGGGRFLPYATTIWLASEDKKGRKVIGPFGWAVLEVN